MIILECWNLSLIKWKMDYVEHAVASKNKEVCFS